MTRARAQHLAACLLLLLVSWSPELPADDSPSDEMQVPESSRTGIKVLVLGERGQQLQPALEALINSELRDSNAQLSFESQAGRVRSWVEQARRDENTLLLAVVDTRQNLSWRVYIVDAERGRAAVRRLPGGVEQDQAAVEAVASIVVSATAALREGLEVASKPVEEVVAPEEAASQPEPRPEPPPAPPRAEAKPTEREATAVATTPSPSLQQQPYYVRAALLASAAAFAKSEPVSYGGKLSLALSTPKNWVVRLAAGRHLPIHVSSDYGDFQVDRSLAGVSVGHLFPFDRLEIEAEASFVAELLERRDARSTQGSSARNQSAYTRTGAELGGRVRYRALGPLALELGLGAAYFARRVRFLAAPESTEIARLWAIVPQVEFGIELRMP